MLLFLLYKTYFNMYDWLYVLQRKMFLIFVNDISTLTISDILHLYVIGNTWWK